MWVVEVNGRSVGFCPGLPDRATTPSFAVLAPDPDAVGVDYAIGEPTLARRGHRHRDALGLAGERPAPLPRRHDLLRGARPPQRGRLRVLDKVGFVRGTWFDEPQRDGAVDHHGRLPPRRRHVVHRLTGLDRAIDHDGAMSLLDCRPDRSTCAPSTPAPRPASTATRRPARRRCAALGDELSDLQERLFAEGADRVAAPRAAGAAGHGHLRQGRGAAPHGRPDRPAGGADHLRSRRRPRRSASTTSSGGSAKALPEPGHRRRLRPLALRGRADRPGARAGADADEIERRYDAINELRGRAGRRRRHDRQVHAAHLRRRAEGAAARPARRPDQALEVQPGRRRRAGAVAGVPGGLRDRAGAHQHRGRAVARRPERPQVVPQPGRRRAAARRAEGPGPAVADGRLRRREQKRRLAEEDPVA